MRFELLFCVVILTSASAYAAKAPIDSAACSALLFPTSDHSRTMDPAVLIANFDEALRERHLTSKINKTGPRDPRQVHVVAEDGQAAAYVKYACYDYGLEILGIEAFGGWRGHHLEELVLSRALADCPKTSQVYFKETFNTYTETSFPGRGDFFRPTKTGEGLEQEVRTARTFQALEPRGFSEIILPENQVAPLILRNPNRSKTWAFKTANFIEKMRAYRVKRTKSTELKTIKVGGVTYEVEGLLGASTSKVYLARNPEGVAVTIKRVVDDPTHNPGWLASINYEKAVSAFYTEKGVVVPQILATEIVRSEGSRTVGYVVKKYHSGILLDDFAKPGLVDPHDEIRLREAWNIEAYRVRMIHRGFRDWLKEKKIELNPEKIKIIDSLIERGDFYGLSYHNWLFDLDRQDWIIFDP